MADRPAPIRATAVAIPQPARNDDVGNVPQCLGDAAAAHAAARPLDTPDQRRPCADEDDRSAACEAGRPR